MVKTSSRIVIIISLDSSRNLVLICNNYYLGTELYSTYTTKFSWEHDLYSREKSGIFLPKVNRYPDVCGRYINQYERLFKLKVTNKLFNVFFN